MGLPTGRVRGWLPANDADAARSTADEAVAVGRRQGAKVVECLAHLVRARVYRETAGGDADRSVARAAIDAGTARAAEVGAYT